MADIAVSTLTTPRWPHAGRRHELSTALSILTSADSAVCGVMLVGDTGVGKSSLADRITDALGGDVHVVTVLPPSKAQPVMLGALAPLLTDVAAADTTSPVAVFRAAAERLDREAGGRAVVLRVEDCHLLDGASARVVRMLTRSRRVRPLMTSRTSPALPDDLLAMWKDGDVSWIDVEPLDRATTSELLRQALGDVVARDTDRLMWDASRGNPLYLRELVRAALRRQELQLSHGVWTWSGRMDPGRLGELVTAELRRLPAAGRDLLELVSLAESLPLPLLFRLADIDTVDSLMELGMLVVDQSAVPPSCRLAHPVYGEAIRMLVPPGRRRVLRERVAGALPAPDHGSLPDLLRWVAWALEAGSVPDHGLLVEAAALANHLHQPVDAQRYADLALLADPPCDVIGAALAERARAYRTLGSSDRAQADLDRFRALPADSASSRYQAHAAITGADIRFYGHADAARALDLLDDAFPRVADDARATADLRAHRLAIRIGAGASSDVLREAVDFLADVSLPLPARVRLAAPVQLSLALAGRVDDAVRLGDRYLAAALSPVSEATAYVSSIHSVGVLVRLFAGDLDAAETMLGREFELDVAHAPQHRAIPGFVEGLLAWARGRWSEAYGHFRVAAGALRHGDPLGMLPAVLAYNAAAAVRLGELEEAARLRADSEQASSLVGSSENSWSRTLLWVGLALRESDAVTAAVDTADRAAREELPPVELDALHVALIGLVDGLPAGPDVTAHSLGERIAAAAGRCRGMSRTEPMVDYARALAADDTAAVARAETLLARHGVWTAPPRSRTVTLTRREEQIAPLAAAGISSRDIARRLTISPRTVESHLARIYAKLGVSSRAQLPSALGGRTPAASAAPAENGPR